MRSKRGPYDQIELVASPGSVPHFVDAREKQIPERPIDHVTDASRVMLRDQTNQSVEVSEAARAAFSVAGPGSVGFEDFWEVSDDVAPN